MRDSGYRIEDKLMAETTKDAAEPAGDAAAGRYWIGQSFLGMVMICVAARGVRAVAFGESEAELVLQACRVFPGARRIETPDDLVGRALAAVDWVAIGGVHEIDLDLGGTVFQRQVWAELRKTMPGDRVSYSELARRLGRPRAARAIAAACAANEIGILVPCHRVVPASGEVGGYRWGAWRKRLLLEIEAPSSAAVA